MTSRDRLRVAFTAIFLYCLVKERWYEAGLAVVSYVLFLALMSTWDLVRGEGRKVDE